MADTFAADTSLLNGERRSLDVFFGPKSVAVIGATDAAGSVGRTLLWNLVSSPFGGTIFPVNPERPSVLGIRAYRTIAEVGQPVDLAIVATPAPTVPGIIGECAAAGVKGAIIVSAGFKEAGPGGLELERQTLAAAERGRLRLLGPNCLGLMRPHGGLNASFARGIARPGSVAFLSQSGALCAAVLDWSLREQVGFSAFISVGSMLDVGWGDLIDYLQDDPHTRSIVIYMETVGHARSFLSAAREVALSKPVIVLKAGRSEAAASAAVSHTGALAGSDAVLDAAFRRCGVLRVSSVADLFAMAEVLASQPNPRGPRLSILTNAGGPGIMAADALLAAGGALAPLAPETLEQLDQALPPHWSHGNPIDILGDADPERYARAAEVAAGDPHTDGLLIILTPQTLADPTEIATRLQRYGRTSGKPVLASWMGGDTVAAGEAALQRAGIPTFPYPDTAARAFQYMWQYSSNLRSLYETPSLPTDSGAGAPDRTGAEQILAATCAAGRTLLNEVESKGLLAAYGIPVVETHPAATPDEAAELAGRIGYPVALKVLSTSIVHKSAAGGVRLHLRDERELRQAFDEINTATSNQFDGVTVQPMIVRPGYELILGSRVDQQFGPVLVFGAGGQLVEVQQDRALGLPPLNTTLARRMIEQTRIFTALRGDSWPGPVDLASLERLVVRFSQLVAEQPTISEIDINPLHVATAGALALDARVLLHGPDADPAQLPKLAIRPYPTQYAAPWTANDGTALDIRPIRPEDEGLMVAFHATLSEQSVYFRYFRALGLDDRVAHERLMRICFIDYDREIALVADQRDPSTGLHRILAVGRLIRARNRPEAEFALLVSDVFQGRGLGTELLRRLIQIGRDEQIRRIVGYILPENRGMARISERLGFRLVRSFDMTTAVLDLR